MTVSAEDLLDFVVKQSEKVLASYRVDPGLVEEHANGERRIAQGGYGDRQIFELIQNAADELQDCPGGEIAVVLTDAALYCANEGNPVTVAGAETILRMSVSRKRGGQIGRFGVGVKSVLAITRTPQFFSTINRERFGFGFDRDWSSRRIYDAAGVDGDTPVLRLARPLDVVGAMAVDPVLAKLLSWATTVVKLPLEDGVTERLAMDLANFPVEFPLFSPHVGTITLSDHRRERSIDRLINHAGHGRRHQIEDERQGQPTRSAEWRVFRRPFEPTAEATQDAGELHDRPELEVSWAVPERSGARGMFWAYFPTKFGTTLRGILNAPWKTSEDRQAIFDGNAFNEALLAEAATLVVESLGGLVDATDPGSYLDFLPGRGREAPQFADERLTAAIWERAADHASVVDQNGVLRPPTEVKLHPEGLKPEWLRTWAECPHRPFDWAHRSLETRERRARINIIMHGAHVSTASVRTWLEALVVSGSAVSSTAAISIAAAMVEQNDLATDEVLRAQIVLTESGKFVAASAEGLFRRTSESDLPGSPIYVHGDVVDAFGASSDLETLGIYEADAAGRLAETVSIGFGGFSETQWASLWELTREAGPERSKGILEPRKSSLRVRTISGDFVATNRCLLVGHVVPADGSRDANVAVDPEFHRSDVELLRWLGLVDRPTLTEEMPSGVWFEDYREWVWHEFIASMPDAASAPQLKTLKIDGPPQVGPLQVFRALSDVGRAAFLSALPSDGIETTWTRQIGRQRATREEVCSPLRWLARTHGFVLTARGTARVAESVGPQLADMSDVFAVADLPPAIARALGLPSSADQVPTDLWRRALEQASRSTDDGLPGRVYSKLHDSGLEWPVGVPTRCRVGAEWSSDTPDEQIAVTSDRSEYDTLVRVAFPALLVPTESTADWLIESWGMLPAVSVIEQEIAFVPESELVPLCDLFPMLKTFRRELLRWSVQRCTELEDVTRTPNGVSAQPVPTHVDGDTVYVVGGQTDLDLLALVDDALGLGLGESGRRSILEQQVRQRENDRARAVRFASSPAAKLLALVGPDRLRAGLPQGLDGADDSASVPEHLAQLAIDAYGDGVLRQYSGDIAARNADAPRYFNGTTAVRQFVAELGMPEEWAGSRVPTPPEVEEIDGPRKYPALHNYQDELAGRMVALLQESVPARTMLRLPTGSGKTRVAVEAVVRLVKQRKLDGPVLWIAQSNELCEQAVQSWKFVWSSVGPEEQITINRFWGGNDATPVQSTTQLVVATDAKLQENLHLDKYEWLRRPSIILVDEAHRAISPRFTDLFEQLGVTRYRTERPLIGLTATPFRGRNEIETQRLVDRFGGHRLDKGLFGDEDPYTALQRMEVLAAVDHRVLPGATLTLSQADLASVERYRVLPSSAEKRLGQDEARNNMILDQISQIDESWPVLVFATSVAHSKLLTARLNGPGRLIGRDRRPDAGCGTQEEDRRL